MALINRTEIWERWNLSKANLGRVLNGMIPAGHMSTEGKRGRPRALYDDAVIAERIKSLGLDKEE